MTIKYIKKAQVLAIAIVTALSLVPTVSYAGFFDWIRESNNGLVNSSNFPIVQSSFIYAQTGFNQLNKEKNQNSLTVFQGDAIVQPTSLLTVGNNKVSTNRKIMTVRASAYSSTPDQTDSSPFITAKGTRVRDGIIAANFLPFNTLVKIPELYGDKVFVVEDRMNARYTNTIDIWFPNRTSALQFGRRTVTIEIAGTL